MADPVDGKSCEFCYLWFFHWCAVKALSVMDIFLQMLGEHFSIVICHDEGEGKSFLPFFLHLETSPGDVEVMFGSHR